MFFPTTGIIIIGFALFNLFVVEIVDNRISIFLIILGLVLMGFEFLYNYAMWGGIKQQKTEKVE